MVIYWQTLFGGTYNPRHPASGTMNKQIILIVIGFVLIFGLAPNFMRGVDVMNPVLDAKGQQVYRADGRPLFKSSPIGQFKVNWDAYTIMAVGGVCILCGIGSSLHKRFRGRENKGSSEQDQSDHRE